MIKNGRFFVAPKHTQENFKQLFARLTAAGAGRPVDEHGFPDGPWSPETLAKEVSSFEANQMGIELRAVQVWFQENDNGISNDNIRWLARIFGCDDPNSASLWQAELKASKDRLASERRAKRQLASSSDQRFDKSDEASELQSSLVESSAVGDDPVCEVKLENRSRFVAKTLAERCERMLSSPASMNVLIVYWLVFCSLGLMNYVLGTLSVTYSPVEGLDKQVGFIWAPTLTILPLVVLPLYIVFVSELNTYWKLLGRSRCTTKEVMSVKRISDAGWYVKVNDFSFSFWAIALFCFFFVFGFQWAGIYMPAYLSGDADGVQIDRYLVALVRPEIISVSEAMVLSAVGYLYTASYIAVFMFGLLFLVIVARDYHDLCMTSVVEGSVTNCEHLRREGLKIVWGSFRVVIFGLWLATLVKLQITYLSSDSRDFVTWLVTDALCALGIAIMHNGWLENTSISHFTTFMMMVVTVTIFLSCVLRVRDVFARVSQDSSEYLFARNGGISGQGWAVIKMTLVIALVSSNLLLIGRLHGFSLILLLSTVASMLVFSGPKLNFYRMDDEADEVLP